MINILPLTTYVRRVLPFSGLRRLCLSGVLIIYAALSLYQINLPGLHYDEAFEAVPALLLLQNRPVTAFRDSGLRLGGRTLPLMTQDYIGAINTYAAIPFIAILGPTPAALRVMSVIVGGITLWLAYALCGQLTGDRRVGLLAGLLLAVDPTFIFWNRQGIFVTAVTATIGLAATLCWLRRFSEKGATCWSVTGAFLFGLGLYAKFLFVWLMGALAGAAILLNLPRFVKQRMKTPVQFRITEVFLAALAFFVGCWPLIVYNIQTGGTFANIAQNVRTSYYGVNNLAFVPNLLERFGQFIVILNGGHFWYLGDIRNSVLPASIFGVVFVCVVLLATRNVLRFNNNALLPLKTALFPFLVIGLVIVASIATVSALWITHFAILMPWPAIALTISSWFIHRHRRLRIGLWPALGLLLVTNFLSTIRYHQSLAVSGGLGAHSDAIYEMSDWLANHANGPVVAMDWGLAAPVTYLTDGRVTPIEVFGYAWKPDVELTHRLESFIAQPATLYLWRAPDEIIFDRSREFKALYRPLNLEETIEEAFYERNGRPVLGVTRLVAKGTAKNPP